MYIVDSLALNSQPVALYNSRLNETSVTHVFSLSRVYTREHQTAPQHYAWEII